MRATLAHLVLIGFLGLLLAGCGGAASPKSGTPPTNSAPTASLSGCVKAWNSESSTSNRNQLGGEAEEGSPSVTVAEYVGTGVQVGGLEGKSVAIDSGRCMVIVGYTALVQQGAGPWLYASLLSSFPSIGYEEGWSRSHANAVASVSELGLVPGVGLLRSASGGEIVDIRREQVTAESSSAIREGSTGTTSASEAESASKATTPGEEEAVPAVTGTTTGAQASAPSEQGCGSFSAVGYRFAEVRAGDGFTCPTVRRFLSLLMDQSGHHYRALPDNGVEIGGYACYVGTGLADCASPEGAQAVSAHYSDAP